MTRDKQVMSLLVKIYVLACRCWFALHSASRACFSGFWLAVLSRPALAKINELFYSDIKMIFKEAYNKMGFYEWEKKAIDKYFKDCRSFLVGAVGGGREALALGRLGYEVDAFESHPLLVKRANELLEKEGLDARVKLAAQDSCAGTEKAHDGIIVGWGAFSHIQTKRQRVNFLRELRKGIRDEGPILLSFFDRDESSFSYKIVFVMANSLKRLLWRRDYIERGDSLASGKRMFVFVHYFTEKEIRDELEEAGFRLIFYNTEQHPYAVGIAAKA